MGTIIFPAPSVRRAKTYNAIVFYICLACIFLFLSSAYTKIVEHERFVHGLSKVLSIGLLAPIVGWLVPLMEILIGILLIIPKTQKLGLYAFTSLMIVFTFYIGGMMIWADKLPCHCNLFIEKLSWGQHLLFNLACIILAIIAVRLSKSKNH
ncbi:hypothetical protein FMM05_20230 [Flavobacterium zepuense]|uniref:Methylamine utilisation protein MauE domain-containing protein n=1 Tax=Flavobacterium zepuense TaxID=2593302 RepID=A0A552UTK7_9FLAO|nr:MauE/DoxX family redox-associated membrane protein [Flavobacterium zepuense]TRW21480.1 hypothetical protein FMM05_20230 [Flavobacterium zepuense]